MRAGPIYLLYWFITFLPSVGALNGGTSIKHGGPSHSHDGTPDDNNTPCACGEEPQHFPNIIIDTVLPGIPAAVGNIMYTHRDPLVEFWTTNQGFQDVQLGEWNSQDPNDPDSLLNTRRISFVKELPSGLGPKRVRIEVTDTTTHFDCCSGMSTSMLSTTRAPHIVRGHNFVVKSRTCLTLEGTSETRLLVTAVVEWSGKNNLRKNIEKAIFEGLKQYHQEITAFMRETIAANQGDYLDLRGAREQCSELNYTCPESQVQYEEQEELYLETSYSLDNNVNLEDAFDSLQRKLYELNQGMRRIERRLDRKSVV